MTCRRSHLTLVTNGGANVIRAASCLARTPQIRELIAAGFLFVVSTSGGKDSQAQTILLRQIIPPSQLLLVHAILPEVDWDGVEDHIHATSSGLPIITAEAKTTFFQMVERRQMFPSADNRQCTSDLKRGPINREVRRYLKANPQFGGKVVMCMGMRAEESPKRSRLEVFKLSTSNSIAGRTWYEWLPIHHLTTDEVFATIAEAGERPLWVYKYLSRASCSFCILASAADLTAAARLRPDLYRRYVQTERRLNFTLSMSGRPLEEITGIAA